MSIYYIALQDELKKSVRSTGKSISSIARSGGLSRETLKRALDGNRITEPKAVFENLFEKEDK